MARAALEQRWLTLTREMIPTLAVSFGWPVRNDHRFQRILLDTGARGVWYDAIVERPAYGDADEAVLRDAVALGEAAITEEGDLAALNR